MTTTISTITGHELRMALYYAAGDEDAGTVSGIEYTNLPSNSLSYVRGFGTYTHTEIFTESDWNSFQFNPIIPLINYGQIMPLDTRPNVIAKPTWSALLAHLTSAYKSITYRTWHKDARELLTNPEKEGRAGLVHYYHRIDDPGVEFEKVVMEQVEGNPFVHETPDHLRETLDAIDVAEIKEISAKNKVFIDGNKDILTMASATDAEAITLGRKYLRDMYTESYRNAEIAKAKASLETTKTALSTDLSVAKRQLLHRMEAKVADARAHILGALDRQGVYSAYNTCTAQKTALTTISQTWQEAVIDVHRAATVSAASTVATTAIAAFNNSVQAITGVPVWKDGAGNTLTLTADRGYVQSFTFATGTKETSPQTIGTYMADNPSGHKGNVAIVNVSVPEGITYEVSVPTTPKSAHQVVLKYIKSSAPTEQMNMEITARNTCGPSKITVSILPPTSSA